MVIYSNEIIGYINLFEKITQTIIKDCFLDEDTLVFVVMPGQLSKALGKQAFNVRKLGNLLKKKLKILEFNPDPKRFVANLIYPIRAEEIRQEDDIIVIKAINMREKGQIFGRDRSNLRKIQKIVSKYFAGLIVKIE